jgi:hypothetical protein
VNVTDVRSGFGRFPGRWCELEPVELEAGRHGAAHERPCAQRLRRLPRVRGYDQLRSFAGAEVGTEVRGLDGTSVRELAGLMATTGSCSRRSPARARPRFCVPWRTARSRSQYRTVSRRRSSRAPRLRVCPFGMRFEVKRLDDP